MGLIILYLSITSRHVMRLNTQLSGGWCSPFRSFENGYKWKLLFARVIRLPNCQSSPQAVVQVFRCFKI